MSIVKQFVDANQKALDTLAENSPNVADALVETLAVLNYYAESNNVSFSPEEAKQIIYGAEVSKPKPKEKKAKMPKEKISEVIENIQSVSPSPKQKITLSMFKPQSIIVSGEVRKIIVDFWSYAESKLEKEIERQGGFSSDGGYTKVDFKVSWTDDRADYVFFDTSMRVNIKEKQEVENAVLKQLLSEFALFFHLTEYVPSESLYGYSSDKKRILDLINQLVMEITQFDYQVQSIDRINSYFFAVLLKLYNHGLPPLINFVENPDLDMDYVKSQKIDFNYPNVITRLRSMLPNDWYQVFIEKNDNYVIEHKSPLWYTGIGEPKLEDFTKWLSVNKSNETTPSQQVVTSHIPTSPNISVTDEVNEMAIVPEKTHLNQDIDALTDEDLLDIDELLK